MTLVATVTNILLRRVTEEEEEAKQFALNNYGVLCAYIRNQYVENVMKVNPAPKG